MDTTKSNLKYLDIEGHPDGRKVFVVRKDDDLTDERPDGVSHRPDGCKGTELHCFCWRNNQLQRHVGRAHRAGPARSDLITRPFVISKKTHIPSISR
jgi:hypothetical protein